MIDLSILVCSVHSRYDTFAPKIQAQLYNQYDELSDDDKERVEIMLLTDNKKMMLGHKRNKMIEIAQGNYIVFVDDDDRIADDYIKELLEATKHGTDSIVFQASVSLNGAPSKRCYYSKDNGHDFNKNDSYYRIPNHICCVKRSIASKVEFPSVVYGEDVSYSTKLISHLKTEHKINRVLYYYDYNAKTTEAQAWKYNRDKPDRPKPKVDVVILSKALDWPTQQMTQRAIDTCYGTANGIPLNITVIENGGRVRYANATTIHKPEYFNFNEFLNTGAGLGQAEWIVCANNDLIFKNGWLHNLMSANNDIVSPKEPKDPRQSHITENTKGFETAVHFSGWCFMIKRSLWEKIGKFDTDIDFWCSDDAVIEQIKAAGSTPMLVPEAIVEHQASTTLNRMEPAEREHRTWGNVYIFNMKYRKNKFADNPNYQAWLKKNNKVTA